MERRTGLKISFFFFLFFSFFIFFFLFSFFFFEGEGGGREDWVSGRIGRAIIGSESESELVKWGVHQPTRE